jgi:hypothetical protein
MTITYEELKEVTNNFDGNDFWYWFLTYDQMDNDGSCQNFTQLKVW